MIGAGIWGSGLAPAFILANNEINTYHRITTYIGFNIPDTGILTYFVVLFICGLISTFLNLVTASISVHYANALDSCLRFVPATSETIVQIVKTVHDTPPPMVAMRNSVNNTPLPPGWTQSVDANGTPYYINTVTATTQWERPASTVSSAILPPPAASSLPTGWTQSVDANGTPYYINTVTATTQWERPSFPVTNSTNAFTTTSANVSPVIQQQAPVVKQWT